MLVSITGKINVISINWLIIYLQSYYIRRKRLCNKTTVWSNHRRTEKSWWTDW